MIRLGIDLGGTKIEIIALSDSGEVMLRERVPTPQGLYQQTLEAIHRLVWKAETTLGVSESTLGIGVPGSLSPTTGLMRNANSTCLNGKPLQSDLEALLGRKVVISNDANCFALSEATDGAGQGASSVFAVIVGTGTGAGIVCHGKLMDGPNGVAGEWGHNTLPWMEPHEYPGKACWCGQHGCIETFLSGPALAQAYGEEGVSAEQVVMLAEQGQARAQDTLTAYEHHMAKALAHVINMLDPEVIVLGGGLSNVRRLYANVPRLWGEFVFSDAVQTRLLPPCFGDSSGVRGAAWLGAQASG